MQADYEYRAIYQEIAGEEITFISFDNAKDWLSQYHSYYKYMPDSFFYPPITGEKEVFRILYMRLSDIVDKQSYNTQCLMALSEYNKKYQFGNSGIAEWFEKYSDLSDKLFLFGVSDYATTTELFKGKQYGLVYYRFELYLSQEELMPVVEFCHLYNSINNIN